MKQKLIAKIHVIKNQAKIDNDVYRDILVRVTGRNSTKTMGINQLLKVVEEFKTLGYASKTRTSNAIYLTISLSMLKVIAH